MGDASLRQDLYIDNDSGGFSILSAGVVPRVIEDGRENDRRFVDEREVIPIHLEGDDSFIVRVVVGGALTAAEADEWVAHVRWPIRVSGGKLVVCAGLDPDCLAEWSEGDNDRNVGAVEVPDGEYLADVYTYLHTMNGRVFLDRDFGEKLGTWFRRDHATRPFPSWVAGELSRDPEEDPGHEKAWRQLAGSVQTGKLQVELDPLDWVGFVVHLQPPDAAAERSTPDEDGWFEATTGLRRPARFPLGVASAARDNEYRAELREILPRPPRPPLQTVDVAARVADRTLAPLRGGYVECPLASLKDVFRLPFLASDSADPEIHLRPPEGRAIEWRPDIEHVAATPLGRGEIGARGVGLRIGFSPTNGKWDHMRAVRLVGEQLPLLPDGTTVELMTAPEPEGDQPRDVGVHRYRGEVRGNVWRIAETYPALDGTLLREALDFSASINEGQSLSLRDEAEGKRALELSHPDDFMFKQNPIVLAPGRIGLTTKDTMLIYWLGGYVFRARWSAVWPCWIAPPDDDGDDED